MTLHHTTSPAERIMRMAAVMLAVITLVATPLLVMQNPAGNDGLQIEDTPTRLEQIKPEGTLYLLTAYTEEYVLRQDSVSRWLGLFTDRHTFLQMEHAYVHFTIDLDKVEYRLDSLNRLLYVGLPAPTVRIASQRTPSMSDDESYWSRIDTNPLIRQAEARIRQKYCTEAHMKKARAYAWETITSLLQPLGLEVRELERHETPQMPKPGHQ